MKLTLLYEKFRIPSYNGISIWYVTDKIRRKLLNQGPPPIDAVFNEGNTNSAAGCVRLTIKGQGTEK